jgi:hypothetical protein
VEPQQLVTLFDALWPRLETALQEVPPGSSVPVNSGDTVLEELVTGVRAVTRELRGVIDKLTERAPDMPAVDVTVEGSFPNFASGQRITFEASRDLLEELGNIAGVLLDDYGVAWDVVDQTRRKPLKITEGRAFAYRGRRSRLQLLLRRFDAPLSSAPT